MNHCHTHSLDPHVRRMGKAFAWAVAINLLFTLVEAVLALVANSSSLLADAGHNLADVLGLGLAWAAHYLQTRSSGQRFSYGYKRSSIVAAVFNAIFLIITVLVIAVHSVEQLLSPNSINEILVIIVAAVGVVMNFGTALLFHSGQHDLNVKAAFVHLLADALISFGVVVGALVIYYTHWYWLDSTIGLMIALVIGLGTWRLFKQAMALMLDAVPEQVCINSVRTCLAAWPGVQEVHDLHVWGLSTTETALTAHLVVPERYLSDQEYWEINALLDKQFGIHHVTIQVERGIAPPT